MRRFIALFSQSLLKVSVLVKKGVQKEKYFLAP